MNAQVIEIVSKLVFGGSLLLIIYIVYFEWKTSQISAEKARIALGEKENEDKVNSLDPNQLVDLVNSDEPSSTEDCPPPKKPGSSV
jgi:hypothetical protein